MGLVVVLLENRKALENIENDEFSSETEMVERLRENGMTEEEEDNLGYYAISDFMDLVNDQVLDNLTGTFFGYVHIK